MFKKIDQHDYLYKNNEPKIEFQVVRCNICNMQYMNPTLTRQSLKKIYNKTYADFWDLDKMTRKEKELHTLSHEKRIRYIQKITNLKKARLLDYGCGKAYFIRNSNKIVPSWDFYGYDFNKNIKKIQEKVKIYYAENISKTPIKKNYFDIVTFNEVIEHFIEPKEEIKKISHYIKKGGHIYIETGNQESLIAKIKGKKHYYYDIYHTSYFSIKTIKKLLNENGFEIVKINDYPLNYDLLRLHQKFNLKCFIRGIIYWILSKIKIRNFAITGGMSVLAKKIR